MDSSNKKVVIGCAIAFATPLLLIATVVVGLWLKAFNDARVDNHLTVGQAIVQWHPESVKKEAMLTPDQRERRDLNDAAWQAVCPIAVFMIGGYFVPVIIAIRRKHPQVVAIGALNIFLGWSFLGWLAALIWALVSENPKLPPPPRNGLT
jgi:hypothetical protein